MFIDSHVHIGSSEKSKRYFTVADYVKFASSLVINGAIVMPNISNITTTFELNNSLLKEISKFRNDKENDIYKDFHLFPFLLIEPRNKDVRQQIQSYRKEIFGMKYHPSIYRYTINNTSLKKYINDARSFNIPILVHCGRDKKSHISNLIKAAEINKDVNFIAAHLGGNASDLIDEAIDILKPLKLNNLYLDTSAVKLPFLIERAVNELGFEKIIFGSDEPYTDLRIAKYCFDLADVERKGRMLGRNITELLGVNI